MEEEGSVYCHVILDNTEDENREGVESNITLSEEPDKSDERDLADDSLSADKPGKRDWNDAWIGALIFVRTDMDAVFSDPDKEEEGWRLLHERLLSEVPGFCVGLRETRGKWLALTETYRAIKEREQWEGVGASLSWGWYSLMDALLGPVFYSTLGGEGEELDGGGPVVEVVVEGTRETFLPSTPTALFLTSPKAPLSVGGQWNKPMVERLIAVRTEMDDLFKRHEGETAEEEEVRVADAWDLLQKRLEEEAPGFSDTVAGTRRKWKMLATTYRTIVEKERRVGVGASAKWEWFAPMEALLGREQAPPGPPPPPPPERPAGRKGLAPAGGRWTVAGVRALILARGEMDPVFKSTPENEAWDLLYERMAKESPGFSHSVKAVKGKWRNLVDTYHLLKEKRRRGVETTTWEWYGQMDAVLGSERAPEACASPQEGPSRAQEPSSIPYGPAREPPPSAPPREEPSPAPTREVPLPAVRAKKPPKPLDPDRWNRAAVEALIALRTELDAEFWDPTEGGKAWDLLHSKLEARVPGFSNSLLGTRRKWASLVETYVVIKDKEGREGVAGPSLKWEWFAPMDALLGSKYVPNKGWETWPTPRPRPRPVQKKTKLRGAKKTNVAGKWSKASVGALIGVRTDMNREFEDSANEEKAWGAVHKRLQKVLPDFDNTLFETMFKWKVLTQTYWENKEKERLSGSRAVTWEYFSLMDALLGGKYVECPKESVLSRLKILIGDSDRKRRSNRSGPTPGKGRPRRGGKRGARAGSGKGRRVGVGDDDSEEDGPPPRKKRTVRRKRAGHSSDYPPPRGKRSRRARVASEDDSPAQKKKTMGSRTAALKPDDDQHSREKARAPVDGENDSVPRKGKRAKASATVDSEDEAAPWRKRKRMATKKKSSCCSEEPAPRLEKKATKRRVSPEEEPAPRDNRRAGASSRRSRRKEAPSAKRAEKKEV